ncbi:hypothetical protein BDZ89DRAFT_1132784 [Hymenopellis radicata]|nr:hypothetical protein BDZ89DRAFT_1132784 [Hymenopellis radicata]
MSNIAVRNPGNDATAPSASRIAKRQRAGAAADKASRKKRALAKPENHLVAYDARSNILNKKLRKLKSSCKSDWKSGWEEQGEFMADICGEIAEWLDDLWNAMMVHGEDPKVIRRCLLRCSEIVRSVRDCNSETEFDDVDADVLIQDQNKHTVFKQESHIDIALQWFWRELLVLFQIKGYNTNGILDDINDFHYYDNVFQWIRTEPEAKEDSRGYPLWDQHWTEAMHEAGKQLIANRDAEDMAEFLKNPTLSIYKILATPALKPRLIDAVQKNIASNMERTVSYSDAVEIYKMNALTDDIVALIPKVSDVPTLGSIAKYLSTQPAKEHKEAGAKVLGDVLLSAKSDVLTELHYAFPNLQDALDWLDGDIIPKIPEAIRMKERHYPYDKIGGTLQKILEKFVQKARATTSRYDEDPLDEDYYENQMYGYGSDSDDESLIYAGREEMRMGPDVQKGITDALLILGEWPDQAEAAAVWDTVRWKNGQDPYGIYGAMDALASECESVKPRVADGIRAMAKTFMCTDLATLQKYMPKRTGYGGMTLPNFRYM